jgi:hypothetical protein
LFSIVILLYYAEFHDLILLLKQNKNNLFVGFFGGGERGAFFISPLPWLLVKN